MNTVISFAQKALVFDKDNQILTIKYSHSKYIGDKLDGKVGLPGGQIDFGENPDKSLIREVKEETGIVITPLLPFYTWTWVYKKGDIDKQIVAVARLARYKSGTISHGIKEEKESRIEKVSWVNIETINLKHFIKDEMPAIEKYLLYRHKNPFLVT